MGSPTADRKLVLDGLAWFMNVTTSVLIVFVNKVLMDPRQGYKFSFATTLCSLHFLACAASIWVAQALGFAQRAKLPWRDTLYFAVVANASIASLNLSLLVNTVGFYQIAKLLIIPFVCCIELFWLKRTFTPATMASVLAVIVGVAIVTVTDVSVNTTGVVIAAISVVTSGMQQIMCGSLQRRHKLSSHQLLSNTAPVQGVMLLVIGPYVDVAITGHWVFDYTATSPALACLAVSCAVAVLVNLSQFMCLGRFSAVTFQVLGHTKTVLVLLTSWLHFHEAMSGRTLLGMLLAVAGMASYGVATSSTARSLGATKEKQDEEVLPLLGRESAGGTTVLGSRGNGSRPARDGSARSMFEVVVKPDSNGLDFKRAPTTGKLLAM